MKKYILPVLALGMALTACEDVPAPYEIKATSNKEEASAVKTLPYSESFSTSLGSFKNVLLSGAGAWAINYSCATATGYDSGTKTTTVGSYILVSPDIDLTAATSAHVSYSYILRYNKGDENQQCLVTKNYTGDPSTTEWIVLSNKHTEGSDYTTFADADITIPSSVLGDTVRVAFYYNTPTSGSTWEVKNFAIAEGTGTTEATGTTYTPSKGSTGGGGSSSSSDVVPTTNVAPTSTVADFLSKADASTVYQLTGVISNVSNTNFGNFDLVDETGSIYIYGLKDANGNNCFTALGLAAGDTITLQGAYTLYNEKAEIKDAVYVSFKKGAGNSGGTSGGDPVVTGDGIVFDMTANVFNITTDKTSAANHYTSGSYGITLQGTSDAGYYYNSKDKYVILGKQGATLTFDAFDFDVYKIEITGRSNASAAVKQNLYVGDQAVSTETTGAQTTNTYVIASSYRKAGNKYTLKVTSAHNTQFTKIVVYKATGSEGGEDVNPDQPSATVQEISIADFLAKKDLNTTYRLSGKIANVVAGKEQYGNFDLVDATGSIYIYGLVDASGAYTFQEHELAEGDELVVEGKYYEYNGKAEISKALYISHKKGSGGTTEPETPDTPTEPETPDTPTEPETPTGDNYVISFTGNAWGLPTSSTAEEASYTLDGKTISFANGNHYYYSGGDCLLMGKSGATLTLPALNYAVSKIIVEGSPTASATVKENIFVGDQAVSTEQTDGTATLTFDVAEAYQVAGTVFSLKVTNAKNTQVKSITFVKK